jgi:hypothetical protein
MPLDLTGLTEDIRKLADPSFAQYAKPQSNQDVAQRWRAAAESYIAGVAPAVAPPVVASAGQTFQSTFLPLAVPPFPNFPLSAAFPAFAGVIAGGMTASGFTGTVNPAPLAGLLQSNVFPLAQAGADSTTIATTLAQTIHSWFTGCTATNISSGATINWS